MAANTPTARSGPPWPLRSWGKTTARGNCSRCSIPSITAAHRNQIATYKVEPYVVAADVYAVAPAHRPGRLDLVHRFGRLDVSAAHRNAAGREPGRRSIAPDSSSAEKLDDLQDPLPLPANRLSHHHHADLPVVRLTPIEHPSMDKS